MRKEENKERTWSRRGGQGEGRRAGSQAIYRTRRGRGVDGDAGVLKQQTRTLIEKVPVTRFSHHCLAQGVFAAFQMLMI